MPSFFEPSPIVLAFFLYKKFGFLLIIVLLAIARLLVARGPSQVFSFAALVAALVGLAAQYGPPILGLYAGPLYRASFQITAAAEGLGILLVATVFMAVSGIVPGRRWPVISLLNGVAFGVLIGLWWVTS